MRETLTPGEIEICQDCLLILANGEGPDDVASDLARRWPMGTITLGRMGSDEDEDTYEAFFSWQSCDGCGSTLGGDRYYVTGWTE